MASLTGFEDTIPEGVQGPDFLGSFNDSGIFTSAKSEALTARPLYEQLNPNQQNPLEPRFSALDQILSVIAGPQYGQMARAQALKKIVPPLVNAYSSKISQALREENFDLADKLNSEFTQVGELSPRAAELSKSFTEAINRRKDTLNTNIGILSSVAEQVKDDPKAMSIVQNLAQYKSTMLPAELNKRLERLLPNVALSEKLGATRQSNVSGKVISQEPIQNQATVDNLPKPVIDAITNDPDLRAIGIDPTEAVNIRNRALSKDASESDKKLNALIGQKISNQVQKLSTLEKAPYNVLSQGGSSIGQAQQDIYGTGSTSPVMGSGGSTGLPQAGQGSSTGAVSSAQPSGSQEQYKGIVSRFAQAYGVPANLALAVLAQESGNGQNQGPSSAQAMGPMQITHNRGPQGQPSTADRLAAQLNKLSGTTAYTPELIMTNPLANMQAGVLELKNLLERNNGDIDKALYGYNPSEKYVRDVKARLQGQETSVKPLLNRVPSSSDNPATQRALQGEAETAKGKTLGTQEGMLQSEPTKLESRTLKLGKDGTLRDAGKRLSIDEAIRGKYFIVNDPKDSDMFKAYASAKSLGNEFNDFLSKISKDELQGFNKALNFGIAQGIKLKGVALGGQGLSALTPDQQEAFVKGKLFGRAVEDVLNTAGVDSSDFDVIKKGLFSTWSTDQSSKDTLRVLQNLIQTVMAARMNSLHPGSAETPERYEGPRLKSLNTSLGEYLKKKEMVDALDRPEGNILPVNGKVLRDQDIASNLRLTPMTSTPEDENSNRVLRLFTPQEAFEESRKRAQESNRRNRMKSMKELVDPVENKTKSKLQGMR